MTVKKTVSNVLNSKGIKIGSAIGAAINIASTVSDYKDARLEGRGVMSSAITAAGNAVMFEAIGLKGILGIGALKALPSVAVNTGLQIESMARGMDRSKNGRAFSTATFTDSKQAFTMRQAGMQLAENSKYNLQQALLGNEASSMHKL